MNDRADLIKFGVGFFKYFSEFVSLVLLQHLDHIVSQGGLPLMNLHIVHCMTFANKSVVVRANVAQLLNKRIN